jgi:DNA-binding IscR family transcriptional regulator
VLPERDVLRRPLPAFPGRRVYVALLLLVELALAQRAGASRDVARLSVAGRCGHGEIQELLEMLEVAGIVARREQGGWLLARAAEDVRAAEIGRVFGWNSLIQPQPVTTSAGAAVDACWHDVLAALDASASVTLATLAASGGGRTGSGQSG